MMLWEDLRAKKLKVPKRYEIEQDKRDQFEELIALWHPKFGKGSEVMTTGEAAGALGISQQTVIRLCDDGSLESFRIPGSKHRRISLAVVVEFSAERNIPLTLSGKFKNN